MVSICSSVLFPLLTKTANILTNELDDYCEMIVCSSLVKFNGTHKLQMQRIEKKGKTLIVHQNNNFSFLE